MWNGFALHSRKQVGALPPLTPSRDRKKSDGLAGENINSVPPYLSFEVKHRVDKRSKCINMFIILCHSLMFIANP